jgi:hypothetical protein
MTTHPLALGEGRLFRALVHRASKTFAGKLYPDGVPRPDIYTKQAVRVVFVFREANLGNRPCDVDMCAEVRDPQFRQSRNGRLGKPGRRLAWWNNKVGSFGHAVLTSLKGVPPPQAFATFDRLRSDERWRAHDFLFPFGFVQIKKVGGGGRSNDEEIEAHASAYAHVLTKQLTLYKPNLVVACGLGGKSPAKLLRKYVLTGAATEHWTRDGRFLWWRFRDGAQPAALLEFLHPSSRASRRARYISLATAVRDIVKVAGLKV